jgi:hypothetical protein
MSGLLKLDLNRMDRDCQDKSRPAKREFEIGNFKFKIKAQRRQPVFYILSILSIPVDSFSGAPAVRDHRRACAQA